MAYRRKMLRTSQVRCRQAAAAGRRGIRRHGARLPLPQQRLQQFGDVHRRLDPELGLGEVRGPPSRPRRPGPGAARASSSVMSSPAKSTAVAPVAWRRKATPSPLEACTTEVSRTRLPFLRKTPGRSCRRRGPPRRRPRQRRRPRAGCAARRRRACPPAACRGPVPRSPPGRRRTSASSSRCSASRVSCGGARAQPGFGAVAADQQGLLRRGGDRPQAGQRPAGDECRRRPRQGGQRGEGGGGARGAAGRPPRGPRGGTWCRRSPWPPAGGPVPAMRRTASSSSGDSVSRARAGSSVRRRQESSRTTFSLQGGQEVGGPEVDVVVQDLLAHGAHPAGGLARAAC